MTREPNFGVVLLIAVLTLVLGFTGAYLGGMNSARETIFNGLLAEGYSVTVDRTIPVGEGRYTIRTWERGVGWVAVER